MINLLEPYALEEAEKYITECLKSGWISYAGPLVARLEEKIKDFTKARYAVAVGSGTGGLWLILKALGIGHGDKVIVPTMTFVATVNAVIHAGAEPVFVGCDESYNIDVKFLEAALMREKNIKAIMPVHMLGNLCNMKKIIKLSKRYNIPVIEDAAQALGTTDNTGKHAGTFGKAGMISFSFNKMITAGNGGIVITNDSNFGKRLKYLSTQAKDNPVTYTHNEAGFNMGLSSINAALAVNQLEKVNKILLLKKKVYEQYKNIPGFKLCNGNHWLNAFETDNGYMYTSKELARLGVQTRPLFLPNHKQKSFTQYAYHGDSTAEECYNKTVCIPSGAGLTDDEINHVIDSIKKVIKNVSNA